jgi:NAD-dependent dihydropyrimidine dehydrogenase PreA subunit
MSDPCQQPPGAFEPVIDRARCDGKADCVVICPYEVFELDILLPEYRKTLPFGAKVKGFVHGWKQSFAARAEACRACGLCVKACPEKAIALKRAQADQG